MAVESQVPDRGHGPPGVLQLTLAERRDQPAGRLVVAVDAPLAQVGGHLLDVGLAQAGQPARFGLAEMLNGETVPVIHRLGEHPGVAAAGPVGGDLLLEDDHFGTRVELLDEERGP
jgi:hypothetical protein